MLGPSLDGKSDSQHVFFNLCCIYVPASFLESSQAHFLMEKWIQFEWFPVIVADDRCRCTFVKSLFVHGFYEGSDT